MSQHSIISAHIHGQTNHLDWEHGRIQFSYGRGMVNNYSSLLLKQLRKHDLCHLRESGRSWIMQDVIVCWERCMCVYQAGREWRRDGGRREGEEEREGGWDRKRKPNSTMSCFTWTMGWQLISIILYNLYKAKGKEKMLNSWSLQLLCMYNSPQLNIHWEIQDARIQVQHYWLW